MIERSKLHHAGFLIKLKQTKKNTATLILKIVNLNLYQILSNVILFRNFNLTSFWTRAGKHFGIINSNVTLISWPSRCLKNNLQPKQSKQSIIRSKLRILQILQKYISVISFCYTLYLFKNKNVNDFGLQIRCLHCMRILHGWKPVQIASPFLVLRTNSR